MKIRLSSLLLALWLALAGGWVACPARASERENESIQPALPPNLILSAKARPVLEKMWRRSPTFRRQCRQIAAAPSLRVKINFVARLTGGGQSRALSTLKRHAHGMKTATIQIIAPGNHVEMIGHEIEHVLEFVEEIDLRALASQGNKDVYRTEDGFYETVRAASAGRRVYEEYIGIRAADGAEE